MNLPPRAVLDAFGARGEVFLLPGGQGGTFRARGTVVKPVGNVREAEWSAGVLAYLECEGFRVPRPIFGADGRAVVEGWVGFEFLEGELAKGTHFGERLAASRALHEALKYLERPDFLDERADPWAVADRVTWHQMPWDPHPRVKPVLECLRELERPILGPWQIVHGDISGNMLLHPELPPGIIDFTPYWAPTGFGEAVFVVDAILWEGADPTSLLGEVDEQLVIRAAIRRLLEVDCHFQLRGLPESTLDQVRDYEWLTVQIRERAASRP